MGYHKILEKQISKYLNEELAGSDELAVFFNSVSEYYFTFEKDKKITEHAFAISEREYQEVVKSITLQNVVMQNSILQLKQAIASLNEDAGEFINNSDYDIIGVIEFLKDQINKSKELESYLIEAKDHAEKASSAKSDFLSVMSHEIRTPLNAIIGYIHLLIQEDPKPSQVQFLNILQVSAANLLSLINDVLDFSKIEEGKIVFANSDFDLRQLMNDVKLAHKIRADENGNKLKVLVDDEVPRFIKGDMTRLTQILNNLISNSVKFTKNGRVTVELQNKQENSEQVEIEFSISDTGIGISQENQSQIFERFTQAHSYITREFGGSGLGLAIIKKLLTLLDSDIHVESELGKGSRFYFSIWFRKSNIIETAAIQPGEAKPGLNGMKVLLVEDVAFNSLLAKKMLTNWNAEVTIAENGLLAVEKVRNNKYDLILMDVQMPVMDGLTASREIRKFNDVVPIFPLTASTSAEMQAKFLKIGIKEFIFKPINPDTLHRTLLKQAGRLA